MYPPIHPSKHRSHLWPAVLMLSLVPRPALLLILLPRYRCHFFCRLLTIQNISLDRIKVLVLDEADLILSYGYEEDLTKLLEGLPQIHQTLLMVRRSCTTLYYSPVQIDLKCWSAKHIFYFRFVDALVCDTLDRREVVAVTGIAQSIRPRNQGKPPAWQGSALAIHNQVGACPHIHIYTYTNTIRNCCNKYVLFRANNTILIVIIKQIRIYVFQKADFYPRV